MILLGFYYLKRLFKKQKCLTALARRN